MFRLCQFELSVVRPYFAVFVTLAVLSLQSSSLALAEDQLPDLQKGELEPGFIEFTNWISIVIDSEEGFSELVEPQADVFAQLYGQTLFDGVSRLDFNGARMSSVLPTAPPPLLVASWEAGEIEDFYARAAWNRSALGTSIGLLVAPNYDVWESQAENVSEVSRSWAAGSSNPQKSVAKGLLKPGEWLDEVVKNVGQSESYEQAARMLVEEGLPDQLADPSDTDGHQVPTGEFIDGLTYEGKLPSATWISTRLAR